MDGALIQPRETADPFARLAPLAGQLSQASRDSRYDVHALLDWPDELPADGYWLSPEISTCHGPVWESLAEPERVALTRAELVHFFSISVDLERELVAEVAARIYRPRFSSVSEFLFDFLAEENDHMWLFSEFCRRYAGGLTDTGWQPSGATRESSAETEDLILFGRILIAEELCDWYNRRLAQDERLPEIVRAVNRVHHRDESRHIAFGRRLIEALAEAAGPEGRREAGAYLARYLDVCVGTLYSPAVYAAAGLPRPAAVRKQAKASPERIRIDAELTARTRKFLTSLDVIGDAAAHG